MQLEELSSLMTLRRYVTVAHHIPGRLRLKFTNKLISSLSKGRLSELETLCSPEGYLRQFSLNTATGSLVLEYQASRISPDLLNQLFGDDEARAREALVQLHHIFTH